MPEDSSSQAANPFGSIKRTFDFVDNFASRLSMGSRKKSKPDVATEERTLPTSPARPSTTEQSDDSPATIATTTDKSPSEDRSDSIAIPQRTNQARSKAQGWYGSFKSKATPITQVHRESISSSTGRDLIASPRRSNTGDGVAKDVASSPHKYMKSETLRRSSKGVPTTSLASTTNVSIVSGKSLENVVNTKVDSAASSVEDPPLPPNPVSEAPKPAKIAADGAGEEPKSSTAGWFTGWWSRPDGYTEQSDSSKTDKIAIKAAIDTPLPAAQSTLDRKDGSSTESQIPEINQPPPQTEQSTIVEARKVEIETDSKSWFWRWSTTQNSQILASTDNGDVKTPEIPQQESSRPSTPLQSVKKATDEDSKSVRSINGTIKTVKDMTARKASGWAFWSQASTPAVNWPTEDSDDGVNRQVGELAVANTASESRPEAAQFNSSAEQTDIAKETPAKDQTQPKQTKTKKDAAKSKKSRKEKAVSEEESKKPSDATTALLKIGSQKKDILLPRFASTYSVVQKPTFLQNLRHYFVGAPQEHPHLHFIEHPRRIKNALAIGTHGFFPNALYQKVLGAPTGTSIKFANMAADAIDSWTEARGYTCKIEKVALEGEGLISDRVETLWKLLLNWVDHIRGADYIQWNCHSQGVPVSVMLVDRLIKFGCLSSSVKIGITAMAGISLGPFSEYRTTLFGRSALELFDFSNPSSKVSIAYREALENVLNHNVKITFVGSLDDQLVSLESSTFSNISHPCIYRAAFIDGRHFTSDFLTELVGFALKLRNLGLSDHGLIRELSPALAGSLYSGEGHSRLYDSPDVYSLAVSHALETTSPHESTAMVIKEYDGPPGKDNNPYFLPWAMRGILEEEKVRKELSEELSDLLSLFEQWKPTTKQLKDIRYKLEALKSKL